MRALIVDDNPMIRNVLGPCFRGPGRDFEIADSIAEANGLLGEMTFDLAILDYHLPDGDGLQLARAIRAGSNNPDMPIVVISAEAQVTFRVMQAGIPGVSFCDKMDGTQALRDVVDLVCESVSR